MDMGIFRILAAEAELHLGSAERANGASRAGALYAASLLYKAAGRLAELESLPAEERDNLAGGEPT